MERCVQRVQPGSHIHTPEGVKKCEGMSRHTPKWTPTLGVGVPMKFGILKKSFQRSKRIRLKSSLYH
jgi:hypothetical protein